MLLVLGSIALALAVHEAWNSMKTFLAVDFYHLYVESRLDTASPVEDFYVGAAQVSIGEEFYQRAVRTGLPRFIADATARRWLDATGTPFLYASMGWLHDRYDTALTQYRLALTVAFCAGVVLLGLHSGMPFWGTLFIAGCLVRFFFPFRGDFIVGNIGSLQLFLLAVALVVIEERPEIGGALLGMLVTLKPTTIVAIVLLIVSRIVTREFKRGRRELAGAVLGGSFGLAIGAMWFRSPVVWLNWLAAARGLWGRFAGREINNVAPALDLFRHYGSWLSYVITAVLAGVVVTAMLYRRRRDDLLVMSLGLLIYCLASKLVWLHYLVLILPAAFALCRRWWGAVVAAVAVCLVADVPYQALVGSLTPETRQPLVDVALISIYVASVCLLVEDSEGVALSRTAAAASSQ